MVGFEIPAAGSPAAHASDIGGDAVSVESSLVEYIKQLNGTVFPSCEQSTRGRSPNAKYISHLQVS